MKSTLPFFFCSLIGFSLSTCTSLHDDKWSDLFNGNDLSGWDSYLGPNFDTIANKFAGEPIGLNRYANPSFTVVTIDGKPCIRIEGRCFGGISTQDEFSNYHLSLQFKWGIAKWPPNRDKVRDSGLLYHAVGPHGADYDFWMRSQEFQVQEGDCGDYWGVAGGVFDIPAVSRGDQEFVYHPSGSLTTFSAIAPAGRRCIKNPDAEKPSGEWNTLELYCFGDTAVHVVNGVMTMVLYKSRQTDGSTEIPLKKGKIQLQSEGAEVYYSSIRIRPIRSIPPEFLAP